MEHFLGFAIPGIPYGCTYALVAVGLVLTYQATGVLNFAYGAQAYLSAFVFTYLVQKRHLPVGVAFVIAVVVLAPAVGLAFDRLLFRKIAPANVIAKLVTGISMLIGIPAILSVLFTNSNQYNPPSILFNPNVVYFRVAGTPINGISVTSVVATAVTLIALRGAHPLDKPRPEDARGGGEPPSDRAGRGERWPGGGFGLGRLGTHRRPGRCPAGP